MKVMPGNESARGRVWRKKSFWWTCGLVLLLLAGAASYERLRPYLVFGLPTATGIAAKLACSGVFVSGRSLQEVVSNDIERLSPLTRGARYDLDSTRQSVTTSMFGLAKRTALYRPGVGCTLLNDTDRQSLLQQASGIREPAQALRADPWPAGDSVDLDDLPERVDAAALTRAVAQAFEEDTPAKDIDTRAMIVVYDGRIVAERYAPGYTQNTRFLGWSASKSVLGTLVGTLVVDGRLMLDDPAPVPEWRSPGDVRREITLNHLLRMSSGLSFSEPYNPGSDSTIMLFLRGDMGGYAAAKPLEHPPGAVWQYSSGTTNLLSRMVWQTVGGSLASYRDYARKRLFEPGGMHSFVLEPDATGAFVGSSFAYATARDWARFGLLYLHRGVLNGREILSPAWVDYVRQPSPADKKRYFGAHFWLNVPRCGSSQREYPNLPADTYLAHGHNTQLVAIIPSRNAVIVRLGWTTGAASFDIDRHFAAILRALGAAGDDHVAACSESN